MKLYFSIRVCVCVCVCVKMKKRIEKRKKKRSKFKVNTHNLYTSNWRTTTSFSSSSSSILNSRNTKLAIKNNNIIKFLFCGFLNYK